MDLKELVTPFLVSGEKLIWVSRPDPTFSMSSNIVKAIVWGIPWTIFFSWWTLSWVDFQFPKFESLSELTSLIGLPFLVMGLGMLASPYLIYSKHCKTIFVITNKRALLIIRNRNAEQTSFYFSKMEGISTKIKSDGSGSIYMGSENKGDSRTPIGFVGLEDVNEALSVLEPLLNNSKN